MAFKAAASSAIKHNGHYRTLANAAGRDRGFPVEYLLIPDEGHGFARPVNNMAALMATETFFAKYLGGRYQYGGTPEVTARLKEVTVDPKSVVLAKQADKDK